MRIFVSSLGLVAATLLTVSACSSVSSKTSLNAWLDEQYQQQLEFSPVQLSRSGDYRRHAEIDEVSEEAFFRQLEWKHDSVSAMQQRFNYAELNQEEQLSYDLWVYQYEQMARQAEFRHLEYVFEQMIGPQSTLPQILIAGHDVNTRQDMDDFNQRIRAIALRLTELLEIAQNRANDGLRPPRFAYQEVIRQSRSVITGAPFTTSGESALWQEARSKVKTLRETTSLSANEADNLLNQTRVALVDELQPAYQALIEWLESDLANTEENPTGVSRHRDGAGYYNYLLWFYTTTDMSAEQIHQLGLKEVTRITEQMDDIRERVGFNGDLEAFFDFIRSDPQFFYPNTDAGREAYLEQARDYLSALEARMPDFFGLLPAIDLEVRRVEPYREQDGAPQHYMRGSLETGRPGVFYAHLSDMSAMPKNELEAIAYHEGIPGHHQQVSVAQQASGIPRFRTQARFTVFTEGWALYAEWLAKEMGGYQDPYSEFGQLVTELWRAVRLVVDTGLHAKHWTYQEAIDYFAQTTPVPMSTIRTEVERYMTIPGQATSFKIGMIRIQQLRENAEQALGESFDIREFHDVVLGGGAMPLSLLERRVDNWINARQL